MSNNYSNVLKKLGYLNLVVNLYILTTILQRFSLKIFHSYIFYVITMIKYINTTLLFWRLFIISLTNKVLNARNFNFEYLPEDPLAGSLNPIASELRTVCVTQSSFASKSMKLERFVTMVFDF